MAKRSIGASEWGWSEYRGYLGDIGVVEKEAEFRGEGKGEEGERRRGLQRSPLCSFHSSSSFSIDSRLLTFDSFCRVCCNTACSVESCLQSNRKKERFEILLWENNTLILERKCCWIPEILKGEDDKLNASVFWILLWKCSMFVHPSLVVLVLLLDFL